MVFRMSTGARLGVPDLQLYAVDTTPKVPVGTIVTGFDDAGIQGEGEFIYLLATVAAAAGQAVAYKTGPNASIALTLTATHANKGRPIAVAVTAVALNSYGWFQIGGCAIVKAVAAAADAIVMSSATGGSLTSAVVAGAQVLGAVFAGALDTPAVGFAYVTLQRPTMQSQIT